MAELQCADTAIEQHDPSGLNCNLFEYQRKALAWMDEREKNSERGGILADDVGLGKTVEIISLMLHHRRPQTAHDPPTRSSATLIATPLHIATQWIDEIKMHAPDLSLYQFPGSDKCDKDAHELARFDVILVTYDVLTKEKWRSLAQPQRSGVRRQPTQYKALLMELDLWRVVLDEVQYAQGGRGAGQMVRLLTAQHRWAVSGTPMRPNMPSDLTHLLSFVCGANYLAEHGWEDLVRAIDERQGKDRLIQKLKPLFLRRTKAEVDAQLHIPPQRSQVHYVTQTYAEEILRDVFVHRSALRLSEKATSRSEDQACEELSDEVLSRHLQLSSLSPSLWAQWGAKGGATSRDKLCSASKLVSELRNFDLVPQDLWSDMQDGLEDEFKSRRADLDEVVTEGLKGLLQEEDDEGFQEIGVGRDAQLRKEKKRRLDGGKLAVLDMALLQLLVAVSTLARLAPSQVAHDAMEVLYTVLSTRLLPDGCASPHLWVKHRVKKAWLLGMDPQHASLPVGTHALMNGEQVRVPYGLPARWAELEPFLWLRFREYDDDERKKATSDSLGFVVALKERRHVQHPDDGVWVGRSMVAINSDKRALTDAKRLLCHTSEGSVNMPFALAMELGDAIRERTKMRRCAVEKCGGLAKEIGNRYPYLLEVAAESTLEALLKGRGDTQVTGWSTKPAPGQRSKSTPLGPEDRDARSRIAQFYRRGKDHAEVKVQKSKRTITEIVTAAGYSSVEALATTVRKRGEDVRANAQKSLAKELKVHAERRANITSDLDQMWRRHQAFKNEEKARKAMQAQKRLGESPSSKVHALVNLLKGDLRGEKVVVFTAFQPAVTMLKSAIQDALGDDGTAVSVATLTSKKDQANIAKFKERPDCRVLVLQAGITHSGSGASGLTLTAAKHVVLMDVLLDPMVELQAIGRVHRIGQKSETTVWHVVSRGSVDVALRHLDAHRYEVRLKTLLRGLVDSLPVDAEVDSQATQAMVASSADEAELEENEDDEEVPVDANEEDQVVVEVEAADDQLDEADDDPMDTSHAAASALVLADAPSPEMATPVLQRAVEAVNTTAPETALQVGPETAPPPSTLAWVERACELLLRGKATPRMVALQARRTAEKSGETINEQSFELLIDLEQERGLNAERIVELQLELGL